MVELHVATVFPTGNKCTRINRYLCYFLNEITLEICFRTLAVIFCGNYVFIIVGNLCFNRCKITRLTLGEEEEKTTETTEKDANEETNDDDEDWSQKLLAERDIKDTQSRVGSRN